MANSDKSLPRPASYDADNVFRYHPPIGDQEDRYALLRAKAREVAELVLELVPPSRERSLALTNLEQAGFWANAGIARNEGEV
jgi:hypothetical protein